MGVLLDDLRKTIGTIRWVRIFIKDGRFRCGEQEVQQADLDDLRAKGITLFMMPDNGRDPLPGSTP